MPGVSFSWYCKDEDYKLFQRYKELFGFKAREAADKELERIKGLSFKTSNNPQIPAVLEDIQEDKVHQESLRNRLRKQSDNAIRAKVSFKRR